MAAYDALFCAIGNAARIQNDALVISVQAFTNTLTSKGYVVAPVSAAPAAPTMQQGLVLDALLRVAEAAEQMDSPGDDLRTAIDALDALPSMYSSVLGSFKARAILAAPTAASDKHLPGWERGIATVTLSGNQLLEALDFVAPDRDTDPDQLDNDLTFGIVRHKGDEGKEAAGMCCWNDDTDGVLPLDGEYVAPTAPSAQMEGECARCSGHAMIYVDNCQTPCPDCQDLSDYDEPEAATPASTPLAVEAAPASTTVDWLGLALDLEQQAKRVESQTVERAMTAAAHGLRLMGRSNPGTEGHHERTGMIPVYCIELTGEGSGSLWFRIITNRDQALKREGGIPFTLSAPEEASDDEITRLVDQAETRGNYVPDAAPGSTEMRG